MFSLNLVQLAPALSLGNSGNNLLGIISTAKTYCCNNLPAFSEICVLIHFSSTTGQAALTILQGLNDKPVSDNLADDFIKWLADLAEDTIDNDDNMKEVGAKRLQCTLVGTLYNVRGY